MTPINQQIEAMESLAQRHYPEDPAQRNACLVRLLEERLRAFAFMLDQQTKREPMGFDELRRVGFSVEEIALGATEVVRS